MPDYRLERPTINGKPTLVWYIIWTEARRSRRRSTGTTDKRQAERTLAEFLSVANAPPEEFTCADLSKAYLAERIEAGVVYPKALANCVRHTDAHFGALPPSLISRATTRTYITRRRAAGVADSTITKELCIFRQTLKFGVREGWMEKEPKVETPGGLVARERFLSRDEFARLWFWSSPLHLRVYLALSISTGARGKHILALTWDRIDFGRGIVRYVPANSRSKKRTAQIPMNDALRSVLERAHAAALTPHVVEWDGKAVKSVRRAYARACRLAGLEDAHRHDLRRTAASWAVADGVSFDRVAAMLGDSVEVTRKHYAMFSPSYLRGVVDSIEGKGG